MPDAHLSEFVPPPNISAGEAQRSVLIEEISKILTQLSDRDRRVIWFLCRQCDFQTASPPKRDEHAFAKKHEFSTAQGVDGERIYKEWRRKALTALRAREGVLRRLNAWLDTARGNAEKLLNEAYDLLLRLKDDDVEFFPEDLVVLENLRTYLKR